MNDVIGDFRTKFDTNLMYVINQKASHFPNHIPNVPMYFSDNGVHPTSQMISDQTSFSCMPSLIQSVNNLNQIQPNMTRFINPQNTNSIRQHAIMTPTMMAQSNKTQKTAMISCSIPDETSIQYQHGDSYPNIHVPYKPRKPVLDSTQNNTMNSNNLGSDMPINVINSYGCNRQPLIEKSMTIFPPNSHTGSIFNNSSHTLPQFYSSVDNGLPLPMFHLYSRLSKLQELDRLTFPVNHGNLWGPQTLRHGDQVTEIQFELCQDNLQQIISRSDLDIVVTSFTHRDQFRLCHWPDFLELRINGHLLPLDTTVMQDLKVHMPCCIKRYCKLGINILQFTVTKCVCCHLFHAYMVHRPTLQHALETIQNKSVTSAITKSLLSEIYLRNPIVVNSPDDSNNLSVVNLICPMSQIRIFIPARTKFCKHLQPFDLQEFLKVQTRWPQYFCPICRVRVTFNLNEYITNIIVDDIVRDIISKVDTGVKRIIIYPDGKWKPATEMNSNVGVSFISQNIADGTNTDISYQTIHQSPITLRSTNQSPMPVHPKPNLCNDYLVDKNSKQLSNPIDFESSIAEIKSARSPCINNVSSSTMLSPAPLRNFYGNSMTTVDSLSRPATPLTSIGIEPSPPKRNKISPTEQTNIDTVSNVLILKCSASDSSDSLNKNDMHSRNSNPYQSDNFVMNQNNNSNSPESIKTPLSTTSISSASQGTCMNNISPHTPCLFPNPLKQSLNNSTFQSTQIVTSSREQQSVIIHDSDITHISSTTGSGNSITSIRPPTSVNGENVNKQASSGSSDPSSPPEFFDPHSATTNYDDDENSSLHLQRLIGFIDEILSEEEEYILDTQWASFTWPSADKSLDLLHLSEIEKFL